MLPKINTHCSKFGNKEKKPESIQIFPEFDYKMKFDGCSKGNPGLAGAGAVIYLFNNEYWAESFFVGENFTNNHAEYAGLILGLQQAKKLGIN